MHRLDQHAEGGAKQRDSAEQLEAEQSKAAGVHAKERQDEAARAGRAHAELVDLLPHAAREWCAALAGYAHDPR